MAQKHACFFFSVFSRTKTNSAHEKLGFSNSIFRFFFVSFYFFFGLTRRNENTAFSLGRRRRRRCGLKNPLRCAALHIVSYAPRSVFSGRPGPAGQPVGNGFPLSRFVNELFYWTVSLFSRSCVSNISSLRVYQTCIANNIVDM